LYADPRPRYGVHAPVFCPTGVAAFARDLDSSKQVWSADEGYPGHPAYRDYYRDIGWSSDVCSSDLYIHVDGKRISTGIKYFRITGKTDQKQVYDRAWALERAADHAGNFMFNRERQVEWLAPVMDRPPIVVAPYDAELFGHWWFEGPEWLDFLYRKLHYDQQIVKPITPAEYLERHDINQVCTPCGSSWGYKGYHEVWLNGGNDWIYRHLHTAARRMEELTRAFPQAEGLTRRALTQAGRELLQFRLPLAREALHVPRIVRLDGHRFEHMQVHNQSPIGSLERLGLTAFRPDRYRDIAEAFRHDIDDVALDRFGYRQRRHHEQAGRSNE